MTTLTKLLEPYDTVVVIGPGGVGKTTTAAAVGALLAQQRRTCVLTIDPAKRLADALGIAEVGNEPVGVAVGSAHLDVVMLDARATFESMIKRHARNEEHAAQIFANPVFANLVTRLSGTQEYMAFERLWELRELDRYETVVVDTPPSQWAIDFLHAPARLARFLDNRVFRFLLKPPPLILRPLAVATRGLVRQIASVVGAQVVDDTIAFFQAFDGLEDGFRERASQTEALLASERTAYVLVLTAEPDPIAVGRQLREALAALGRDVVAVVVNRLPPDLDAAPSDPEAPLELRSLAAGLERARRAGIDRVRHAFADLPLIAVEELSQPIASTASLAQLVAVLGERELESQPTQRVDPADE